MATYACSDTHGFYTCYEKIKQILNPEDKVYFLGDAGDRGPHSWQTTKAILSDPQFIYLKGNHEDMLVQAVRDELYDSWDRYYYFLLASNGGLQTYEDCLCDPYCKLYIKELSNLPLIETYVNAQEQKIYLSHAGFSPVAYAAKPTQDALLWDRGHIRDKASELWEDVIIVHGHTPCKKTKYAQGHKFNIDKGIFHSGKVMLLNLDTWEETIIKS